MPRGSSEIDEELGETVPPPRVSRTITPLPISAQRFMLELREGSPVGDYQIQDQIGEGAMGTVFSAVHALVGKPVAIKVLKPELCTNQTSIDRFVQEAQAVNKIGHPNIVDVFSLDMLPDGRAYMVMEWLHGEDLKARLSRGPITVANTCDILDGIARALDAAHAKDIIHRDLKPDNVFLHQVDDSLLMVKLLDFGIAKLVKAQSDIEKTRTGNMLGTPRYISPEQARGVDVTAKSDIYSLGVLAYEMLAGRAPFEGETGMDLVIKHLSEEPPPLSQFAKLPKPLEQCVMRMLSKDPTQRPTLAEVRQILQDPTKKLKRIPLTTRQLAMMAGGAFLVVIGAFVSWKLIGGTRAEETGPNVEPAVITMTSEPKVQATVPETTPSPSPSVQPPIDPSKKTTIEVAITGPKTAKVFVDGEELVNAKGDIEPGGHDIEVRTPGRKTMQQHVEIEAGTAMVLPITVPAAITRPPLHPPKKPPVKQPPVKQPPDDDDLLKPKDVLKKGKK